MKRSETKKTVGNAARMREIHSRVLIPRISVLSELAVRVRAARHERVFEKMRCGLARRLK